MKIFRHAAPFLAALLLSACAAGPEAVGLEKTTYKALPGWGDDKTAETLPALMKSCGRIAKKDPDDAVSRVDWAGSAKAWQDACAPLFLLLLGTDD
ncbi:MAG: hypothetical protein OXT65_04610 [Alphaproteobacteria bacterium]|nr:hypothetical protein [Alphaproteobacteria bacterium]